MRIRLFFSSLALTLLLLLPMVGLVEYFAIQRQMQERVRRANAAGTAVQVDPASRYMGSRLLAVQKEEPEFILLRMDAPAATLTLRGLPGIMQLAAPRGTTTLAAAYLAAGPARAAQLLGDTLGTAPQHYLAATPSCCQLLGAGHHRAAGYGRAGDRCGQLQCLGGGWHHPVRDPEPARRRVRNGGQTAVTRTGRD